ncbi:unnamed protein product [Penicillium salamii]|nr:unnamed protein product [Penicillium salamii]
MSTTSQNIYDNPEFFTAYGNLPRSQHGLSAAPEWPVLRQMILKSNPSTQETENPLKGQRILDLGCGYGWFVRWARENGASYIRGVDISQNMINRAEETETETALKSSDNHTSAHSAGKISLEVSDLETIKLSDKPDREAYDMVYSSLTFHYIEDIPRLFREVNASLKRRGVHGKAGRFVFSIEHPVSTAPVSPGPEWKTIQENGKDYKVWPLNSYGDEGLRLTNWLGTAGVRKYHRSVETYITALLDSGFVLTGLKDWSPSEEDVKGQPNWSVERHRPYFLLISAEVSI